MEPKNNGEFSSEDNTNDKTTVIYILIILNKLS